MKTHSTHSNKGFTLLEILLVIAAIGILAAIVLVAINPNRQLAQARNAQRRSDVLAISNAVYQNIIDTGTTGALNTITTTVSVIRLNTGTTTCHSNTAATAVSGNNITPTESINLATELTTNATYLPSIPRDPQSSDTTNCSDYTIVKDANNRITVGAPRTESPAIDDISVTR